MTSVHLGHLAGGGNLFWPRGKYAKSGNNCEGIILTQLLFLPGLKQESLEGNKSSSNLLKAINLLS